MMRVTVWHNISTDSVGRLIATSDGYWPGHSLVPVARWDVEPGRDLIAVCDEIYRLLNVGEDRTFGTPDPWALEYRQKENRSLSVGDVVQFYDGHYVNWYTCARFGWMPIGEPTFFAIGASRHGSTSLPEDDLRRG